VPPDDQRKRHLAGPVASGAKARRRRVRAPDRRELEHRLRLRRRRQRSRRASPASRGGPPACSRPPSAAWSSFGRLTGPGSMPRCSGPAVARTADRCSPRGPAAAPRCPRPGDGRAARGRPCPRRAPWSVKCSVVSDVRTLRNRAQSATARTLGRESDSRVAYSVEVDTSVCSDSRTDMTSAPACDREHARAASRVTASCR
jgi:hypothetical protein